MQKPEKKERQKYSAPTMMDYGTILNLTHGDSGSKGWDIGSGFKAAIAP